MPAKATLYNCRGDVVFDYGTGARNHCYFNQHSTLLMLCGFGALRGDMECWSLKDNTKLSQAQSADTTHFEWAPGNEITYYPRIYFMSEYYRITVFRWNSLCMRYNCPETSSFKWLEGVSLSWSSNW